MNQSHLTVARRGAALVTGLCVLALHPDARLTRAVALQDKPPVFSEVPAQSTPPQAPQPAPPPSPQDWIAPLKKHDAGTPAASPPAAGTTGTYGTNGTYAASPRAAGAPASAGSPTPAASQPPASPPAASPVVVQPVVVQPVVAQPVVVEPPAAPPAEEAIKDQTLYEFQATSLDLRAALALFGRANHLNIVPDNDVAGTVTLDVRDLPLSLMMRALLEASDCTWSQEGGLIRVRSHETRIFHVDYLRLSRRGVGFSSATLGSGAMGGGGMGGGGMGGGGGGMGGGGMG
ncbi:MAG TPA: hypothetical protein VN829_14460, partial [Dongiaceae bacterium]|nr:hypothetical protein [Dongiaceae bacterium]